MSLQVQRVVTGHDASGRAIVLSDSNAPNVRSQEAFDVEVAHLWLTDASPADNADSEDEAVGDLAIQPPANGTVFRLVMVHRGEEPCVIATVQIDARPL